MSQVANFAIFKRHLNGHASLFQPNSVEYTYLASAINLSIELLSTPNARLSLARLATRFDDTQITTWYPRFHGDVNRAGPLVTSFLSNVRAAFPMVCVDETITNRDVLAYHPRGEWSGDFNPRNQAVNINASRVADMISTANAGNGANFRIFQFQLAHTFLHEVGGHLLITYLGRGRPFTPPDIQHPLYPGGEAGRALELMMFGGAFEYYRDPNQNNQQPGVPHFLRPSQMVQKVAQGAINDFVQYRFNFPYALTGPEVHMSTMQSMGGGAIAGNTGPGPHFMSQSLRQGYAVYLADVRSVPMNPTIRVRVAT